MKKIYYRDLIFYVLLTLFIGSFPAFFINIKEIYNELIKPDIFPPSIVFPIVWTIIYILLGISIYRIEIMDAPNENAIKILYFFALFVNALWTPIFFGLNAYLFAFFWLILLFILVLIMVIKFYKIDKISAFINIPYLLWLIFAGYLNYTIYLLN